MREGTYTDETIIQLKKTYQKSRVNYDITRDPVWIRGKWISFRPISVLDGKVGLWIPDEFEILPEHIAKIQYPTFYRPKVLLSGPDFSEMLGYHLIEKGERELNSSIRQMEEVILLHAPETVIYEKGSLQAKGAEGRWFEYKNFTLNEETYHLQFLLGSKEFLLVGGFHCRMRFYEEWKTPIFHAFEQITFP